MDYVYTLKAKDEKKVGDNLIDASILKITDMSMKPSNPRETIDEDRFNFKVRRGTPPEESSSSKKKPLKLKRGPTREEIMARKIPFVPKAPSVPIENSFTLSSDSPEQKQKAAKHATEQYGVYVIETIVPDERTLQRALINKPKIHIVNETILKAVEFTHSQNNPIPPKQVIEKVRDEIVTRIERISPFKLANKGKEKELQLSEQNARTVSETVKIPDKIFEIPPPQRSESSRVKFNAEQERREQFKIEQERGNQRKQPSQSYPVKAGVKRQQAENEPLPVADRGSGSNTNNNNINNMSMSDMITDQVYGVIQFMLLPWPFLDKVYKHAGIYKRQLADIALDFYYHGKTVEESVQEASKIMQVELQKAARKEGVTTVRNRNGKVLSQTIGYQGRHTRSRGPPQDRPRNWYDSESLTGNKYGFYMVDPDKEAKAVKKARRS